MIAGMMIFKMVGAQYMAAGQSERFILTFKVFTFFTLGVTASALVAALLRRTAVAFDYGESACVFASTANCTSVYVAQCDVMDDSYTRQN